MLLYLFASIEMNHRSYSTKSKHVLRTFLHFVTFNSLLHFLIEIFQQIFFDFLSFFSKNKIFSNCFVVVPRALVEIDLEGIEFHLFLFSG